MGRTAVMGLGLGLGVALALGLALAPLAPVCADPLRLERTDPNHLGSGALAPTGPDPWPEHVLRYDDRMVFRLPAEVGKWATVDKRLTRLCGLGAFRQERRLSLYASAAGTSYGIAFAEGANLHDPQHLAKPGMVYFFSQADSSHCIVLVARRDRIAAFATINLTGNPSGSPSGSPSGAGATPPPSAPPPGRP